MHSDFIQIIDACETFHFLRSHGARNCLRNFCLSDQLGMDMYKQLPIIERENVREFFRLLSNSCNFSSEILVKLTSFEEQQKK